MKHLSPLLLTSILGLLNACVSIPRAPASPPPEAQSHVFEGESYDEVFRATKQVMRREGYQIRQDDGEGGKLVAYLRKPAGDTGIWEAVEGSRAYHKGEHYEITIAMQTAGSEKVLAHMKLERIEEYSLGGRHGREVADPRLYAVFYEKINRELELRKTSEKR